jgi:hypothetical protein
MRFKLRFRHWLPLVSGVLLLTARAVPMPRYGSLLGFPTLCPLKALTGLPCPGCGITRALVLCAHGQWSAAFEFHPLGPLVFGFSVIAFCSGVLLLWRGDKMPGASSQFLQRFATVMAFGFALLLIATWILRMLNVVPFPPNF